MDNLNSAKTDTINLQQFVTPDQNPPISSNTLFVHGDVVLIQHQDSQYYLRRTRNGKLILTK